MRLKTGISPRFYFRRPQRTSGGGRLLRGRGNIAQKNVNPAITQRTMQTDAAGLSGLMSHPHPVPVDL
jgi:hypothetical protein